MYKANAVMRCEPSIQVRNLQSCNHAPQVAFAEHNRASAAATPTSARSSMAGGTSSRSPAVFAPAAAPPVDARTCRLRSIWQMCPTPGARAWARQQRWQQQQQQQQQESSGQDPFGECPAASPPGCLLLVARAWPTTRLARGTASLSPRLLEAVGGELPHEQVLLVFSGGPASGCECLWGILALSVGYLRVACECPTDCLQGMGVWPRACNAARWPGAACPLLVPVACDALIQPPAGGPFNVPRVCLDCALIVP
eukprot:354244-Chlamydomonas_euryale.AAC.3